MKAVRLHGYGGVDQLRYEEIDRPKIISATDVVVQLKAAALNHIDIWNRRGLTGMEVEMPHILGGDGAGTVAETGPDVANVKPCDPVCLYPAIGCGKCEFCLNDQDYMCIYVRVLGERINGTYTEYVRVPAQNCFRIPPGLSFEEAAAFPLVFL